MRNILYIIFMLTVFSGASEAQEIEAVDTVTSAPGITIETSVNLSEVYIGDLITYSLSITRDSDVVLTPPPIGANLGSFDVKNYEDLGETRLDGGRIKTESRFMLTTFTTGDYIIPPIPVEFMLPDSTRKILISEPVPVKVLSLLAEGADTADIRDLKAQIEFKSSWPWWYYVIATVVLLIVIAFVLWRILGGKKEEKKPVDTRKPWEIAFEDLAILKEKNLLTGGEYKKYYIELTDIIRGFLQRVYKISVLDMTTYEFMEAVPELDIEDDLASMLRKILEFADLVKFAKFIPESEKAYADFDEACNIVDIIRKSELIKIQAQPVPVASAESSGGENV